MARRGYQDFQGFDPRTKTTGTFYLSLDDWEYIERYTPEARKLMIHGVKEVVEHPKVAFLGLRTVDTTFGDPRDFVEVPDPDGLCLSAFPPPSVIMAMGVGSSERDGYTFAVFVDKNLTLTDWDWIRVARFDAHHPIGWRARFDERLWQSH